MDLSTKFGKEIPSRNLRKKRSVSYPANSSPKMAVAITKFAANAPGRKEGCDCTGNQTKAALASAKIIKILPQSAVKGPKFFKKSGPKKKFDCVFGLGRVGVFPTSSEVVETYVRLQHSLLPSVTL